MRNTAYDVVIIGAGPAGLAAAITLRKYADVQVLVIDSGKADKIRPGESIPPAALSCINFLGLREQFDCAGHFAYPGNASVWGRDMVGFNDAVLDPLGPPWRLNRLVFDQILVIATDERGVAINWETQYIEQQPIANGYELTLYERIKRQKYSVRTQMVIDASGAGAHFARSLGVKTHIEDQLLGLVRFSTIDSGKMTAQTLLEADKNGWWYAAKLPDNKLVSMYVTEAYTLRQMKNDMAENFSNGIRQTQLLAPRLAPLMLSDHHYYKFPVYSSFLEKVYEERWLAAGDAALCFDPIAAQGIYKSLSTGIRAGKTAVEMLTSNFTDINSAKMYQEYIDANYHTYVNERNHLYQQEQRWPQSNFWKNRIQAQNKAPNTISESKREFQIL
ncbi:FAD-dependent monooxygenase [Mucilaginibacter jinjuensis]|uniref:FAD-dependent monooxygenase n=1 Tax=Mucilaginibacter jinjuensis TaxID=1176721 RepID=A0ABY7TDS3_9SPHI|nr:FAD-dependent monooxygenase [Mucilaginibacter jinjuensis]WCT13782.1 FAD-dependent monooxygenase [Mucilaginibacter jinjuensis]